MRNSVEATILRGSAHAGSVWKIKISERKDVVSASCAGRSLRGELVGGGRRGGSGRGAAE